MLDIFLSSLMCTASPVVISALRNAPLMSITVIFLFSYAAMLSSVNTELVATVGADKSSYSS